MQPDYLLVLPWHFRDFFLESERFVDRNLVFPLPQLELVRTTGAKETATKAPGLESPSDKVASSARAPIH
jgi:hypothetical protein